MVHEVIIEPRRQHSRKPEKFYQRVERYSEGPRLDMFARQSRPGWTAWGHERTKFDTAPFVDSESISATTA